MMEAPELIMSLGLRAGGGITADGNKHNSQQTANKQNKAA